MPESTTTDPVDASFAGLMNALVELIRTGARPDLLEAQRLLLQRLAVQGDVFPARIPPPRNITEVGGYLNLLETAGHRDLRSSAIASALGIAGPSPSVEAMTAAVPVGFVDIPNDRPDSPAQLSIPPLLSIRADFHAPLTAALAAVRAAGCALPLRAPRATLPPSQPGASPAAPEDEVVMAVLGRSLEVFPGTVLVDPTADALALARLETPGTDPFRLVARVLDGGTALPEQSWVAMRATANAVVNDPPALRRCLDVAPIMASAGWNHPLPPVLPTGLSQRGTRVLFRNVTGLVAGETTLGDELGLLHTSAAIARSALATFTGWTWGGSRFVAAA